MNIKITKEQSELLDKYTTLEIPFGDPDGEDMDFLCIIEPNRQMDSAVHNNNHFLFYKDGNNNVDKLYTTPRMIVNALITGSSDLPYKLFCLGMFEHTSFLKGVCYNTFDTVKMARCLLGVAERDLKQSVNHKDRDKKLKWVDTYVWYVEEMICGADDQWYRITDDFPTLEYIKYLRNYITKVLPKSIDEKDVDLLLNRLHTIPQSDFQELNFIDKVYLNNWRESL